MAKKEKPKIVAKDKDESEIKELAWDIVTEKVFTERHIKQVDLNLLGHIFIVLSFLDKDDLDKISEFGMIYEYIDKALPRSINRYPMFTSCCFLTKNDAKKVWDLVDVFDSMKDQI